MLINHQTWISCKTVLINAVHTSQQGFHSHMKKFATHDEIARDGCHKSVKSHGQWVISCQELLEQLQQALKNEADEVWRKDLAALQARKKVTVEQMAKDKEQSRKMKESGKCILLSKYLGEGRHFCYCTFKTIFGRLCTFSMVFRQKLFPGSNKESIHLGKFNAAKNIPENEC